MVVVRLITAGSAGAVRGQESRGSGKTERFHPLAAIPIHRVERSAPSWREGAVALTRFHLHLVSDSTGETVHSVARACLVQFDEAQAIEHVWSMVRTRSQIDRVIAGVEANPGLVLFTMVNDALRQLLQEGCRRLQVPAIPVLDPVIGALASYLGPREPRPAGQAASARQRIFRPHRRDDLCHQP